MQKYQKLPNKHTKIQQNTTITPNIYIRIATTYRLQNTTLKTNKILHNATKNKRTHIAKLHRIQNVHHIYIYNNTKKNQNQPEQK